MSSQHAQFRCSHLLFDMDGTLLNSHAPMVRAYTEWAHRHGVDPEQVIRAAQGRRTIDTMRAFAPKGVDVEAEALALMRREQEDVEGIVEIPGAGALLRALPGDRWAVVTSADRTLALARLKAAGLPTPSQLVSAEDVLHGKPSPDGFRLGAQRLNAEPARCIVFEDAPAGIAAGLAAGSRVIAIASSVLATSDSGAHLCVKDLRAVSVSLDNNELVLHVSAHDTSVPTGGGVQ